MKLGLLPLVGVAALPFAAAWFVETAAAQESAAAAPQAVKSARPTIRERIAQLGSADAATRDAAMKALAAEGEAARAALEAARKTGDAETRFSAAQLLDRLDQEMAARARAMASVGGRLRESEPPAQDETPRRIRSRRLVTGDEAGRAADSDRGGHDESSDPVTDRRRTLRVMPGLFDDAKLREMHEQMAVRMRELFDGEDPFAPFFQFDDQAQGSPGSSFSRVIETDGKREKVEVKVDADGRAKAVVERDGKVETFAADSLDLLREQQPQLFEGFGQLRLELRGPDFDRVARPPQKVQKVQPPQATRQLREVAPPPPPAGPRLGIQVEPLDPAVAEYLELDAGVGLRVIEVEPDSAAAEIGVRRNDVVLEVNGRTIRGVADVQAALKGTKPVAADLIVLRKGQRLEL